jgi:hypothetical protein
LLWLVVVVKFLTPPVVYWPWALPMFGPTPAVALPTTTAPAGGQPDEGAPSPPNAGER